MKQALAALAVITACGALYLLLWPVPVDPVAWAAPVDRGLVDPFGPDNRLKRARAIDLGAYDGPEDVTLGSDGHYYATTEQGMILRIDARDDVEAYVDVGGRPLGIEAHPDGSLIVANAYLGLQRVGADRSVTTVLDAVDNRPLQYTDDVAIAADGTLYFSEASTRFGAAEFGGTYAASLLDILEHGGHGMVIEFRPQTAATRVLLTGLNFANGVAISEDQQYLLVAETGSYRILKHWLEGPNAGRTDVLLDNLPGFPDNINNGRDGRFWIGLVSPRSEPLDRLSDRPFLRKVVQRLPAAFRPQAIPSSHVIAINGDGQVLMNLQDPRARFPALTGVLETRTALYLTSLFGKQLGVLAKDDL